MGGMGTVFQAKETEVTWDLNPLQIAIVPFSFSS
jgi:hypothetical protein